MGEEGRPSGRGTDLTTVKEKQEGMGARQDELQMEYRSPNNSDRLKDNP